MDTKKALLVGGIGFLLFAPLWKTGQERGVSVVGALARHTIFYKEAGQIDEVMVEDTYKDDFLRAGFNGNRVSY